MHKTIEPAIHYWGTPVVLISSTNQDGSANLAPMSSAWWIGWSCMLGLDASSCTAENLLRQRECVLNLPTPALSEAVDRLALLTGSPEVPRHKQFLGYQHEADKFGAAGLTPQPSDTVAAPRVLECPVQLEAVVEEARPFGKNDPRMPVPTLCFELRIVGVHVEESLLQAPGSHRIDPEAWQPLFMMFRHLFGGLVPLQAGRLATGAEEMYAPWKFKRHAAPA
jgi:flavin reductase (DIM6/NTAB) family NADH-FMN oxidoreductase RutF